MEEHNNYFEHVVCNLCGADDFDVIYPSRHQEGHVSVEDIVEVYRSSGDQALMDQLVKCRSCGLQYLTPRLKQNLILEGYQQGSDETFVSQVTARERTFAQCLKWMERFIPHPGNILDIGTAGGSFLNVAKKQGWNVKGCEPNRWLSEWGKKNYGVDIFPGTVFDMDAEESYFDVITLWDVLEHTPSPEKVLERCSTLLKSGGFLVVNYPDIGTWVARLMGRKWVFLLSVHLYYFTLATMRKTLDRHGFEVVKHRPHWQQLEINYIFQRMRPYIPRLADAGQKLVKFLRCEKMQIPYWVGQSLVLARIKKR